MKALKYPNMLRYTLENIEEARAAANRARKFAYESARNILSTGLDPNHLESNPQAPQPIVSPHSPPTHQKFVTEGYARGITIGFPSRNRIVLSGSLP